MDKKNVVPERLALVGGQGCWNVVDEGGDEVFCISSSLWDVGGLIKTEAAMQAIALKVAARFNDGDLIGREMKFVYPYYGKPDGFPDLTAHSGQVVTVLEVDSVPEDGDTVYCVKFEDGTRGQVRRSELSDVAVGTIHPKTAVFMSQHVGAAGDEFELMTSMNLSPMIQSRVTGKTWSLGWQELVQLAIAAGVNKED